MLMNVLICSAGRRVSLVTYFMNEVKKYGDSYKVFTTDLDPDLSAASLLADGKFKVGKFKDPDYIDSILAICVQNEIRIVVPTLDPELEILADARDVFMQKGIHIIISDSNFIKTCRDKRKMNVYFEEHGFRVPKSIDRHNPTFPLFIKPIDGSSSKDLYFIKDRSMLSQYHVDNDKLMFMEYLPAELFEEYTIDLYYDKTFQLKCVVPRMRIAVRGGETNKGITQRNKLVQLVREKLHTISGARGCLTLQVFMEKKGTDVYGIEINPRFGGGYPLSYLAGANFPAWILQEYVLNKELDSFDDWKDNLLLLRYDQEMVIPNFKYDA